MKILRNYRALPALALPLCLLLGRALALGLSLTSIAEAANPWLSQDRSFDAFSQPTASLPASQEWDFREGRALFRQPWLMAPARDDADFVGLGPTYNDISCLGCHMGNGRGQAPEGGEPFHGLLVRLSLPGPGPHGGPRPHPAYGDQLNDHAIPGVQAEGEARISYRDKPVTLADGTDIILREPHLGLRDPAFGPFGKAILTSARIAQPVFGLGLLEAIPAEDIEALAHAQTKAHAEGRSPIHGRTNHVWSIADNRIVMGRFGWKANQPSIRQQAAGAANGDMGITSPLFPHKNCPPPQTACQAAAIGPQPDLSGARLDQLTLYLRALAPPASHDQDQPAARHGAEIFAALDCATCHRAEWQTGASAAFPQAGGQTLHPYSDLLLHDMGPGLADGRPDFQAGGRDWRTPPLWGLGLTATVSTHPVFLHDGRARSLTEAILWHGGEAQSARDAFTKLRLGDRNDLLTFLNSL